MKKKFLTLGLAAAVAASLAACGGSSSETTAAETAAAETEAAGEAAEETEAAEGEEAEAGAADGAVFKIGGIGPITGDAAAYGIAVQRGAELAVMIEKNPKAAACIRENLEHTRLADRAVVMERDVLEGLRRLEGRNYRFDIIFMDPPYGQGLEQKVLRQLRDSSLIDSHTRIIIEASKDTDFSWLASEGYELVRDKQYKTNRHVFAVRKED